MANRDDMNRVIRATMRRFGGEVLGGNTNRTAAKQIYFRILLNGKEVDLMIDVNSRGTIIWGFARDTNHLHAEERNIIGDFIQQQIHGG